MVTIKQARQVACKLFLSSSFLKKNDYNESSAFLDVDVLIEFILKKNRAWILSHQDFDFSKFYDEFIRLAERRSTGLPIAYIIGTKEFYGYNFFVSPSVLIPKPDTELLVDEAILSGKHILNKKNKTEDASFSMLDICTGTGCIGVSIIAEIYLMLKQVYLQIDDRLHFILADISEEALKICKKNVLKILSKDILPSVDIKKLDLKKDLFILANNNQKYDLISANPPYVPSNITYELLKDGRSEPKLALDGGVDGLDLISPLAKNIHHSLKKSGLAFVEVGEYNAEEALQIFKKEGFTNVSILKDLSGKKRVLKIIGC